jgi:hypothetical protein
LDSENRISRREMLRNIGIAGAVAWAAPVLTSLPAHASTDGKRQCRRACKGKGECCQVGCTQCSSNTNCPSEVGDGAYCFNLMIGGVPSSKLKCGPDIFCGQHAVCTDAADCATGEVCITLNGCDGCTGSSGICMPKCKVCKLAGAGARRPFVRMGRTAGGQ